MKVSDLPFNQFVGIIENPDRSVSVAIRAHHKNHLSTVHASVLFSAAEAASGAWVIANLASALPDVVAVTRNGTIQYKKPAFNSITATVTKASSSAAELIDQVSNRGMARVTLDVRIESDGATVAISTFEWVFQKPRPAA